MIKRFTTFLMLVVAASALWSITPGGAGTAQAQNRRIMLEEFTGSWCGWCVRGALAEEQLYAKYPGDVVAVSVHNGDPMVTPQGDSLQQGHPLFPSGTKVTGYPDGWTARMATSNAWNVDPGTWIDTLNATGIVDNLIGSAAKASVTVDNISFDLATHMISVRVSAKFKSAMSGDFRLTVYVTENDVADASNTGYTQHNYYYHNTNFPESPYYNQGTGAAGNATITGFKHQHVFRGCPDAVWGTKGVIPSSVTAGTAYTQTYTFPLPGSVTNPNNVHIIGFVNQYSTTSVATNQILDVEEHPLTTTPIKIGTPVTLSADDGVYQYAKANGDLATKVSVTNDGTDAAVVTMAVDQANALPAGWAVTFKPQSVTVAPGRTETVEVTFSAPDASSYVQPMIWFTPAEAGAYTNSTAITFGLLSDNTKYGMFYFPTLGPEYAGLAGLPDGLRTRAAVIPISTASLTAFDATKMDIAMFLNDPMLDQTGTTYSWSPAIKTINSMLRDGKKVFISSTDAMAWAYIGPTATKTKAVQAFYKDTLGLVFKRNVSRVESNAYVPFRLDGISGDVIGDGIGVDANSPGLYAYAGETPVFTLSATSKSVPMFYADQYPDSLVAVRYQSKTGARLVYLGFTLNSFGDQEAADTVFSRSINWLMSAPSSPAKLDVTPGPIAFGTVDVGSSNSKSVTLTNAGSQPLTVKAINLIPSGLDFSMSAPSLPLTLAPSETSTIGLTFSPSTAGPESGTLTITLTDESTTVLQLQGSGASSTGAVAGKDATPVAGFSASPNPFHGVTSVTYTAEAGERNVTFSAYNLLGQEVAKLASTVAGENTYAISFDASTLAAGTYVVVAHSSKGSQEIRVVNQR